MPSVHNGIGTWYYGRKNQQSRQGYCSQCKKYGTLSSYDTRLYFVIFFIPVIPLGRKRVIDDCSSCKRHRVAKLDDWEKGKRKAIDEGLEKMAANPNDPEAVKNLHGIYLYFGERGDADKLLQFMKERFADDAKTQFYIGGALEFIGRNQEATACFERAFALNPDMPEAKRAVGMGFIEQGKLDDARTLLKYLEEGKQKDPAVLYRLALGFQSAKRHKEAIEIFGIVVQQSPATSQEKFFRKAVQKSELALNLKTSVLPPRKRNTKALIGWSVVAAAVLVGLLAWNYYVYKNQRLYVVSGYSKPVNVSIEGSDSLTVQGSNPFPVKISEGKHHVIITGAIDQELDIQISTGFFNRYFGSPVFVLNVGGSRVLSHETTVYARVPVNEGSYELLYGQPLISFDHVDYAFTAFPKTLKLDSNSSKVTRSRVGLVDVPAMNVVLDLLFQSKTDEALNFAEWHLRLHPEDAATLDLYGAIGRSPQQNARATAFVKKGCKRRPVEIEWHRSYQHMGKREDHEKLEAEYDALLNADPQNSAMLYLRGRLYDESKLAIPLYLKSIEKDAKNPFPHYAMGYRCMTHADWPGARKYMGEAMALSTDAIEFKRSFYWTRFAMGEYAELEKEMRAERAAAPLDEDLAERTVDVLIAQNKSREALAVVQDYENQGRANPDLDFSFAVRLRGHYLYVTGDFPALEKLTQRSANPNAKLPGAVREDARYPDLQAIALLEQGRLKDAAQLPSLAPNANLDPFLCLGLSVAWKQGGDENGAKEWRERAQKSLTKSESAEYTRVAAILAEEKPPDLERVLDIAIGPEELAVLLTVLSQRFPESAAQYAAPARTLNTDFAFPHQLLKRVLGK